MKIRTGFVSNSSSSSFIINESHYPKTIDIANEMITTINETDQEYSSYKNFNIYNKLTENPNLFKNSNLSISNPNIKLHTDNYDTYIAHLPISKCYLITTSNNYNWGFYNITIDAPQFQEVKNELLLINWTDDTIESMEDFEYILPQLFWYWDCKLNLVIKSHIKNDEIFDFNYDYCKNHGSYKFNILNENNIYCPECYLEQLKFKESIKNNPKFIFNIRK